jgi:hypothetical protein
MKIVSCLKHSLPALAGLFVMSQSVHAQFADEVLSYNSGTGFASGFTNASAALGSPALGSSVTPYAPPFSKSQLVSIGAGGEITLQMDSPILNTAANPYGLDFIIFANSFFVESGGSGQSATTSGSLFYHASTIQIEVSQDDVNWYTLNPALAPQAGEWFPTYGGGNPVTPVNPALMNSSDFAGLTLAQVESLYDGSAGGTGYSLSWAQDSSGNSVDLSSVDYVQIDVESGVLDLDAVSVVPEPSTWALIFVGAGLLFYGRKAVSWHGHKPSPHPDPLPSHRMGAEREQLSAANRELVDLTKTSETQHCRRGNFFCISLLFLFCLLAAASARAMIFTENFTNNPAQDGWQVFGDTDLFAWDSTNDVMDVTWDSTQPNSYFYHPLGTTLTIADGFTVSFNIQMNDISYETDPFYPMNLAVGLFNYNEATNSGFSRPDGTTPDIFEFDYFPDNGLGQPNLSAVLADDTISATNESDFYFIYDVLPMEPGVNYQVTLTHAPGASNLCATVYTDGQVYTTMPDVFSAPIVDFHLDTLSISSYQEDATYPDDLLAHGTVGNFVVTTTPAPVAGPIVESENFTRNPLQSGWQEFGDTNLFTWDSTNKVMDVTWDSTQPNSYFYRPLGTTLTMADGFTVNFDIQLNDIAYESDPFYPMNLAVGLFNYGEATNSGFSRPDGTSPDIFEFDYFPDNGLGEPNLSAVLADDTVSATNESDFYFIYDVLPMEPGTTYHVSLIHAAGATSLSAIVYTNGVVYSTMPNAFTAPIVGFNLDTLSISSYEEDATYPDNLLAHGTVGNFTLTLPPAVRHRSDTYSNGVSQVQFASYVNWNYMLQRSTDLVTWQEVSPCVVGTGNVMTLSDTSAPGDKAFYRVVAAQP